LTPRDASASACLPATDVVCESARLVMRRVRGDDAAFIFALLNDPDWIRYIGDKNIRTHDDARRYIDATLIAMTARNGFGLDVVVRKADGVPIGLCGLIKRDALEDVDVGFAFLPAFRGEGYAREAAAAALAYGASAFGLRRVAAITSTGNARSIHLLESLGFTFQSVIELWPGDPGTNLYLRDIAAA
jgi:RimJ/RimL family protein N-acetyltransferase